MKLRIVSDNCYGTHCRVEDAETGEPLLDVISADVHIDGTSIITATLVVEVAAFDVVTDAVLVPGVRG